MRAYGRRDRAARFVLFWTLKEAYLKGLGIGLSRDPAELSVLSDHEQPRFLVDERGVDPELDWRLVSARHGEHCLALAHLGDREVRWLRATRCLP